MLAKDSGVSSVIGLVVLVTALKGQPMMSAGVRPMLVKGDAAKDAAWRRLSAGSAAFRRAEVRFSAVWGAALLGECVVRAVGAYTVPVETMVWLGTVIMVATLVLAFLVSGRVGAVPMERMIAEEVGAGKAGTPRADRPGPGDGKGPERSHERLLSGPFPCCGDYPGGN